MTWPTSSIQAVAQVNPKLAAADRPDPDELVSFVPMAAVSGETLRIETEAERPFSEVAKGYTPFRRGDVVIAKITPCFENGKMALAEDLVHELGFGTTEFHVIRPSDKISGSYLFHLLRSPYVRKAGAMKMKGAAGQRRVPADFFASLQIPLPPLAEQTRIAAILDATDALRAKRRESLAQLDTLLQSTFLDMFGDPVTNPMGWEKTTLEDFSVKVTDGEHHTPKRTDSGIKLLSARNVLDGDIDLSNTDFVGTAEYERMIKRCHPERGDVLISCSGSIGRVSRIRFDEPVVLVRSAALVKIDHARAVTEFVEYLLRTPALKGAMLRSAKSVAQANLFQKPIRNLPVFVPPLDLQNRFAAIVESVERLKAAQRAHLDELDNLFASLQSRAFRGDL